MPQWILWRYGPAANKEAGHEKDLASDDMSLKNSFNMHLQ